ncbi:MAG: hypothetical protein ORN51_08560 [Akkermansiaceae bacterium]|nr:hypothetical protein [Akkermansiaceae bacterium]
MNTRFFRFITAFGGLLLAPLASAQLELKCTPVNRLVIVARDTAAADAVHSDEEDYNQYLDDSAKSEPGYTVPGRYYFVLDFNAANFYRWVPTSNGFRFKNQDELSSIITITNPGSGYTSPPEVFITAPPSGTQATAVATVANGAVTAITLTRRGSGYYNFKPTVIIAPPPLPKVSIPSGPAVINRQFAGMAATSATAGPTDDRPWPRSTSTINTTGTIADSLGGRYPRAAYTPEGSVVPSVTMVLKRASFGYAFSSGVPLYLMGDEILPPTKDALGADLTKPNYWRAQPVLPGETFSDVNLGNLSVTDQPVLADGEVTVTSCATDSSVVTVQSVPATLLTGSTLLGSKVYLINGTTLTLAGSANRNITTPVPVRFQPYQRFYYSKHANKVFATQTGQVAITWVSNLPDQREGESKPTYKFRTEVFSVASGSRKPAKQIYWTEKTFTGPLVEVPKGRIEIVNPIFNQSFPGKSAEYVPIGGNSGFVSTTGAAEQRTLWFDPQQSATTPNSLRAYNAEGRVFVEYLGKPFGDSGQQVFLGADIVEVIRTAPVETITTLLGEKLRPRSGSAVAGDERLTAPVGTSLENYCYQYPRPDSAVDYYAERENTNPDNVIIHWMAKQDAALYTTAGLGVSELDISWPQMKRNYIQKWPDSLAQYEPVNVILGSDKKAYGPRFAATSLPVLAHQDDPLGREVEIDGPAQRLRIDFSSSVDLTNRSLLRFTGGGAPYYSRFYIQSKDLLGKPASTVNNVTTPAVYTLNDLNADGVADWSPSSLTIRTSPEDLGQPPIGDATKATVGARIDPPRADYALAGQIVSGTCYSPSAYIDPFGSGGFEAAARGAIIPVNSLPTNKLTVFWYKKVTPANAKIAPFYVPAIAARYEVRWPENPQELVIASLKGLENPGLTSVQASGSIYRQPDTTLPGYNPNEEHALMVDQNVYALRDDLNLPTSSAPFVLLQYTDAVDRRPAMRVAKVVRETETYPLVYDKIAGTPLTRPIPLATAFPMSPKNLDGTVRDEEVEVAKDSLPLLANDQAPAEFIKAYDKFTFVDRKGTHWLSRGPHADQQPKFGMKFYYTQRADFDFPALALDKQPALGSIQPFIADAGKGSSVTLTYQPKWPDDPSLPDAQRSVVPELLMAETLGKPKASEIRGNLPQVFGQTSAQILYQQSMAKKLNASSVTLHDPIRQKKSAMDKLPPGLRTSDYAGKTYFQGLPPNLQNRFFYDATQKQLVLIGQFVDEIATLDYFNLNQLSKQDVDDLKALLPAAAAAADKTAWTDAIDGLSTTLETFRESTTVPGTYVVEAGLNRKISVTGRSDITDPDTAVAGYALSSTGSGTGYVTLVFGNGKAFTDPGDPVQMQIIKVVPTLYPGDLKVLLSSNPLDEKVTLRHSGDYGGQPENFEFRWRYAFNDSNGNAPVLPQDNSTPNSAWMDPDQTPYSLGGSILVGADKSAVLKGPAVLMGDVNFTMSYRLRGSGDAGWSAWTKPQLVEGWIKRVLAKITPFNQRMTDLYNNSINTDVSMLTQAGTRWEGDIALNMENVNDAGLIEIYETVLNRGKGFTINSDLDTASTNNALILAAGYLNDLYTILGNEAYADAANPTISVDDKNSVTEVNTSRFAFEGQVASSLDEELALLRGRDDFNAQGTAGAPAYNRLWWNYTRGINSGEALYAVNYNISEKSGSSTANGIVDAADAYRMFPQGHGDAYGHYLTALKGYYKLLTHPYFTWRPSAETVTVLGVPVTVDYKDERKFVAAAANVGRTAQQVLGLVYRQSYQDNPNAGWSQFRDGKKNPSSKVVRHQGLDETASRATQGAFLHWIVGNALLPDVDAAHTGIQKIDRTTVPELNELPSLALSYQTTMDSANARLNPLGLAPGAIAFDLDPYFNNSLGQELADPTVVGKSHYEQLSVRAVQALNNAAGSFNQAAIMTRSLRTQQNQISDFQNSIEDEAYASRQELLDLYGKPYAGDIGAGKPYPQGYDDPDYNRWFIIDRPSDLVDTVKPVTVTLRVPTLVKTFTGGAIDDIISSYRTDTVTKSFPVTPNQWVQFADVVGPSTALGKRPYSGALQQALLDAHLAQVALISANDGVQKLKAKFEREEEVFKGLVKSHVASQESQIKFGSSALVYDTAAAVLDSIADAQDAIGDLAKDGADAAAEALPKVFGLANDVTSPARGFLKLGAWVITTAARASSVASRAVARDLEIEGKTALFSNDVLQNQLGFAQEELQAAYEFEQTYREITSQHTQFVALLAAHQSAMQKVQDLQTKGEALRLRRETLRQRAAAVINGYRTKDLTFRLFRNEALEQYRTLFDLGSRYSYLAAKAYDYETGLLGSTQGSAVFSKIVASRSLGDLTGGVPHSTTSTLGDAGLAGSMAQLNADFAVAEGRLGINNPDHNNTVFSLRGELFRILPHVEPLDATASGLTADQKAEITATNAAHKSADEAWQQTLEQHIVPNLLSDPQVAAYCRNLKKADGSAVPGFIIPFSSTIQHGLNFFGLPLAAGDHAYSASTFGTKIAASGIALAGYLGMESIDYQGNFIPPDTSANALSATPYAYLIPCGTDQMRTPLGDTGEARSWQVNDQALPMPYNLGGSAFNTTQYFSANDTLSEQPWVIRKHQAFRCVADPGTFISDFPIIYSSARLIGRSAWNSQWKIVIPAYTLLNDEQKAMNNFAASVTNIYLFFRTYSHSGN